MAATSFILRRADQIEEIRNFRANIGLLGKYLSRPAANDKKTCFLMFGLMRSGTTLLGDLLACHPDVTWLGEVSTQRAYFPVLLLSAVARAAPTACVGLKAFSYHMARKPIFTMDQHKYNIDRGRRIIGKLLAGGWKFIRVTRTDVFAQAVSLTRATDSSVWHQFDKRGGIGRFRLNLSDFKSNLDFLLDCRAYEADVFSVFDVLQINYEVDLRDSRHHQATAEKVFEYLCLPAAPVSSEMVRLTGEQLDRKIENYEELMRAAESLGVSARLD